MVAYSYKSSFIEPIRLKVKRQTIRLPRKRHARPGEGLQFFTGPRMQPVRIGGAVCVAAREVRLDFRNHEVTQDDAITLSSAEELDAFAVRDGFGGRDRLGLTPWEFMGLWWRLTHPDQPIFAGILIDWDDSFQAVA